MEDTVSCMAVMTVAIGMAAHVLGCLSSAHNTHFLFHGYTDVSLNRLKHLDQYWHWWTDIVQLSHFAQ